MSDDDRSTARQRLALGRRDFMRAVAAGGAAALTAGAGLPGCGGSGAATRRYLSVGQRATLEALADAIIPEDETVGALAADAVEYVDRWLAEYALAVGQGPASELDAAATTALWNEAIAAHQRGDLAAAIAAYEVFLAAQPGCVPALHLAAVARRDAGDAEGAARLLAATLEAAPRYTEAVVAAARLALDRHDPDAAARSRPTRLVRSRHRSWISGRPNGGRG